MNARIDKLQKLIENNIDNTEKALIIIALDCVKAGTTFKTVKASANFYKWNIPQLDSFIRLMEK